jgi:two-component sensor histidine kinase
MWLASLVAAWLAVERLVTRNVRKLSKSIKSFASGNRIVGDVEVGQAPVEIRDMAEAYVTMTETIMRDEAELDNTIHQKEVLLREVHHRVKNNLQLIASIMNMQVRRVQSTEARRMLSDLRDRVMSLATIHRELFETAGRADIHSDELLTSIVRQVTSAGLAPGRHVDTTTSFEDIRMTPDQAVPLGLLVAEALTSAMKHGKDMTGKGVRIKVDIRRSGKDKATLEVASSCDKPDNMTDPHTGLGTQLIAAFAMQLGGTVDREQRDGTYSLRVAFPIHPLAAAELRHEGQQVA